LSTSFRNFLITFGVCLLVFGLIGWKVIFPALNGVINEDNTSGTESNVSTNANSNDTTNTVSSDVVVEGDIFTAVIVGKSPDGQVASIIYFRVNEVTKRFSYCFIPTDLKMVNSIGVDVPLESLLSTLSGEDIIKKVSATVGVRIDYYAILGTEELTAIVDKFSNAKLNITAEVKFLNPEYTDEVVNFETSEEIPQEYYITIAQGNNSLDADLVKNIMAYDTVNEYHTLTKLLYESVFIEFFTNSGTKNDYASLLNQIKTTNITPAALDTYSDIVFSYFQYKEIVNYPTKSSASSTYDIEKAIKDFRKADGTK